LPASISISLIQILSGYYLIDTKKNIYLFTLPPLIAGLIFVIYQDNFLDMKKIVGIFLIFIVSIRVSNRARLLMKIIIEKNIKLYYAIMGAIHGLSNMGGGLLSLLALSVYKDPVKIRANISYVYFIFAFSQMIVLIGINPDAYEYFNWHYPVLALISYFIVTMTNFEKISNKSYQVAITGVILFYGVISLIV
jgi:hypothetical protein